MPSYKLTYFDARGRAELVRLMFAAKEVEYEDVRITREEWPNVKPNTPFGQIPMLEVDGKKFSQSLAIASYVARELGFYGSSNQDALEIDQVVQLVADFIVEAVKIFKESDEAKKAELIKTFGTDVVPKFLGFFTKLLKANENGVFVGSSLTLADFAVFDFVSGIEKRHPGTLENYPEVKTLVEKVQSEPKIKTYLENRKVTEF